MVTASKLDKRPWGDPIAEKASYWAVVTSDGSTVRLAHDKHHDPLEAAMDCYGISTETMHAINLGTTRTEFNKKRKTVVTAPSTYKYLAYTTNFWGKGDTAEEAIGALVEQGGDTSIDKHGYAMFRVHPETTVEGIHGNFLHPEGCPPIKLYQKSKPA